MTKDKQNVFSAKVAAIFIMAVGWGWIDGNFVPDDTTYLYNALIHCIPLIILLILTLRFFRLSGNGGMGRSNRGLTIFAITTLIALIVLIGLGASNPDPNAVGVKTLPDWFPTIIQASGCLLWLVTQILSRRSETNTSSIQD
jgi:surface polysaccharide O-acyltransferase-like enzyme